MCAGHQKFFWQNLLIGITMEQGDGFLHILLRNLKKKFNVKICVPIIESIFELKFPICKWYFLNRYPYWRG